MRERVASNHQRFWEKTFLDWRSKEINRIKQPSDFKERYQAFLYIFFALWFVSVHVLYINILYLRLRKKSVKALENLDFEYFHWSWMILQKSLGQIFSTHKEKCSFLCAICASQTRRKISFSLNGLMIPPEALECFPIHQLPKQNSMKMNQATLSLEDFKLRKDVLESYFQSILSISDEKQGK